MITIPGGGDIRDVEARAHGLTAVAEVREPDGGTWHPMQVNSGQVTVGELGAIPCRAARLQVMSWSDETDDITDYLSPFGSWIRLFHQVRRVGGTIITVPLGYYRVEAMAINPLDGTIDVTLADPGAVVVDYGLTTLAQGQLLPTTTYLAALQTMLGACFDGIPPWWSTLLDPGTASSTATPTARLQYTGERAVAAADLAARLSRRLTVALDGAAVFRLVTARDATDASDITIRPGQLGNLTELGTDMNRDGIANTALVTYTREVKTAGARTRIEQRRLIDTYDPADADTRASGPFGHVTIDVESTNLADDTAAITAADTVLKKTLTQVRDVAIDTSPIYGMEAGDIIRMEDNQGIATKGILAGAGLGLTARDNWQVTVRTFVPVGKWSGPRRTVLTDAYQARDDADWQDLASKTVDLTGATTKGWTPTAATLKDGGSRMLLTATGASTAQLHTGLVYPVPGERRARVRFSITNLPWQSGDLIINRDIRARAYLDPNGSGPLYGAWTTIRVKKTATVPAEVLMGAGTTFAIGVQLQLLNGAALPSGQKATVGHVNVEVALRKTT